MNIIFVGQIKYSNIVLLKFVILVIVAADDNGHFPSIVVVVVVVVVHAAAAAASAAAKVASAFEKGAIVVVVVAVVIAAVVVVTVFRCDRHFLPVGVSILHLLKVKRVLFECPNDVAVEVGRVEIRRRVFFQDGNCPLKSAHNKMKSVKGFIQVNVSLFLERFGVYIQLQETVLNGAQIF